MTQLKYAGPRPYISQHGISYKDGKEDKYVYIQNAIQLLKNIDHDYEIQRSYSSDIILKSLDQDVIDKILIQYEDNLKDKIELEIKNYQIKIQEEIDHINNLKNISDIEKEVWCNNINLMKDYRIQRAINKVYYFHCINDIKTIILKQHIKKITTPFNEKFWHILQTLQGVLETGTKSVSTLLDEKSLNDMQIIELNIGI